MPRSHITSRHDALYRDAVEGLLGDLGKKVKVEIVPSANGSPFCTNCVWDAVHHCSSGTYNSSGPHPFTGKVCPVCAGKGRIVTASTVRIPEAIVRFGKVSTSDGKVFMPEGELPHGFARVRCRVRWFAQAQDAVAWRLDGIRYTRVGEVRKRGLKSFVVIEVVLRQDE